jgi:hypothetical protein
MAIASGSGATTSSSGTPVASIADCGSTKVVSGGGYRVSTFNVNDSDSSDDWGVENYPSDSSGNLDATGTARYWTARVVRASSGNNRTITAYAFCVNP